MFFRNYTYLQLSHFAFENKIPMIVFRVYTHTQVRPEASFADVLHFGSAYKEN